MKKAKIFYGTEWKNVDSTDAKFDFLSDHKNIQFLANQDCTRLSFPVPS